MQLANGSVFLLRTKVNDDSNFTHCSKRTFSDILEGMVLQNFSVGKPPDPHLSSAPFPQYQEVRRLVVGATLVY